MTSPSNVRRFTVTETREAVEVTADNLDEVAAWCGGRPVRATIDDPFHAVQYQRRGHTSRELRGHVYPGEVLVRDGLGYCHVPRDEFEQASEQWTEEAR